MNNTNTPRCDEWRDMDYQNLAELLEQELNASKVEIERLREALDTLTLVVGLTPIAGNKEALQEAYDLARKALNPTEK